MTAAASGARRALVTGASSGIGAAFARALAARGLDLVLVARTVPALEALATELRAAHGVTVDVIPADLADQAAPHAILDELAARGIEIGTLVNNAGFATYGELVTLAPERERDEVMVNVLAPQQLTRALLPAMLARRAGAIVNVASNAAFQPVPYMATYGATKAFLLSFSEALAEEVRGSGVRVLALCPGQTETPFFTGIDDARLGRARSPEQVVRTALRALDRGRVVIVDGIANTLLAQSARISPRWLTRRVAGIMQKPSAPANRPRSAG
ncbi:dehydrogenase [Vulcanimicrobium alpinum]|uniref:Dehydrogenase n=1 Tax=Vulcanimicrobium alpinum TaxID=3016050 RepID=A0AAN1XZ51_UNVUL|nr:SDR family oxidoreductase [Vulcanimicrobium alpinum]BDE08072.1 dehydrogenase [Vulcanimicrobium alpinum]